MAEGGYIAIIVEGVRREPDYWNSLSSCFFSSSKKLKFICLPAGKNIYMLWKQLQADDFETDIIELIRESCKENRENLRGLARKSFQEIYLFFDFDPQQDNLPKNGGIPSQDILKSMMRTFDNETELGKLYISYPMAEALRDITEWGCDSFYRCTVPISDVPDYKSITGREENRFARIFPYSYETWMMIFAIFLKRCNCLFNRQQCMLKEDALILWYKKEITPLFILERELLLWETHKAVFVLSAFPEFVIDYFRPEHWNSLKENLRDVQVKTGRDCDEMRELI